MTTTAELGSSTRGIWTRQQALTALTRRQVDGLVRRREWQAPWPGVYADAGYALDLQQRGVAAALASGPRAVVCGRLAARLHGLPLVDDQDPATQRYEHLVEDVAVPHHAVDLVSVDDGGSERRLARHRRSYDEQATTTVGGIVVTTVLQTIVDCGRLLRPDALVCLLDAALHRRLVTPAELAAAVEQQLWRPGVVALRTAVARADGRAESPLETLGRLLLLPYLPGLEPQYRLRDGGGRVLARFDLAQPVLRLAAEGDGSTHLGARSAARDQRRDRVSDRHGWRTERYTWFEVRCRQAQLLRRMLEAGGEQAGRHRLRII